MYTDDKKGLRVFITGLACDDVYLKSFEGVKEALRRQSLEFREIEVVYPSAMEGDPLAYLDDKVGIEVMDVLNRLDSFHRAMLSLEKVSGTNRWFDCDNGSGYLINKYMERLYAREQEVTMAPIKIQMSLGL